MRIYDLAMGGDHASRLWFGLCEGCTRGVERTTRGEALRTRTYDGPGCANDAPCPGCDATVCPSDGRKVEDEAGVYCEGCADDMDTTTPVWETDPVDYNE